MSLNHPGDILNATAEYKINKQRLYSTWIGPAISRWNQYAADARIIIAEAKKQKRFPFYNVKKAITERENEFINACNVPYLEYLSKLSRFKNEDAKHLFEAVVAKEYIKKFSGAFEKAGGLHYNGPS